MIMPSIVNTNPSAALFDAGTEPSLAETTRLHAHLSLCKGTGGRLFALQCVAETMGGFVAARVVTTLAFIALLMGVASLFV